MNSKKITFFLLALCIGLLPAFRAGQNPALNTLKISYTKLSLPEIIELEKSLNAKDVSSEYQEALKPDLYPNKKKYPLATPVTFLRTETPSFSNRVEYYYDSKDNSVKAIVYEWNELTENDRMSKKEKEAKLAAFRNKFEELEKHITHQLGAPGFQNIESNRLVSVFKDEERWIDVQEMNVALSIAGNKENGFSQIRLVVYKD